MRAIFHLIIMISCLLSCAHQTHDRINVYHVIIISYLYSALYHILSLCYPDHQTDTKTKMESFNANMSNNLTIYKGNRRFKLTFSLSQLYL